MDHFSNKPSTDFSEDQDNFINDDFFNQTDTSEVRVNPLVLAEVSKPIPLTHDSNSSDDSKEVSPSNSLEVEDDFYKMLLKDYVKNYMYFDKKIDFTFQSMKKTNKETVSQSGRETNESKSDNDSNSNNSEEEMLDDSDDDGYGGYNEYSECEKNLTNDESYYLPGDRLEEILGESIICID